MTTLEVLGVFVGIPLAICGAITAAVYAWERVFAGRRKPASVPQPAPEPRRRAAAEAEPFDEGQRGPEQHDGEENK